MTNKIYKEKDRKEKPNFWVKPNCPNGEKFGETLSAKIEKTAHQSKNLIELLLHVAAVHVAAVHVAAVHVAAALARTNCDLGDLTRWVSCTYSDCVLAGKFVYSRSL